MLTIAILLLSIVLTPTIELSSLHTKSVEYLSVDELKDKYHQLDKESQTSILLVLIRLCNETRATTQVLNASVTFENHNDLVNITAFFQGNRLIIKNLSIKEIKSFVYSEINLDFKI